MTERVIEPLHLVQTQRGWEVDAGPVGPEGNLRTYILSNIRSAEVLDETFEPPAGLELQLERQRKTVKGLCCVDGSRLGREGGSVKRARCLRATVPMPSGLTGFRFPPVVILLVVRWYLRYGLS